MRRIVAGPIVFILSILTLTLLFNACGKSELTPEEYFAAVIDSALVDIPLQAGAWGDPMDIIQIDSIASYARQYLEMGGELSGAELLKISNLALSKFDFSAGRRFVDLSLEASRAANDSQVIACGLGSLGLVAMGTHDFPLANRSLQEAVLIHRVRGDKAAEVIEIKHLAALAQFNEDLNETLRHLQSAVVLYGELEKHKQHAEMTWTVGLIQMDLGQHDSALINLARAQTIIAAHPEEVGEEPEIIQQAIDSLKRIR